MPADSGAIREGGVVREWRRSAVPHFLYKLSVHRRGAEFAESTQRTHLSVLCASAVKARTTMSPMNGHWGHWGTLGHWGQPERRHRSLETASTLSRILKAVPRPCNFSRRTWPPCTSACWAGADDQSSSSDRCAAVTCGRIGSDRNPVRENGGRTALRRRRSACTFSEMRGGVQAVPFHPHFVADVLSAAGIEIQPGLPAEVIAELVSIYGTATGSKK